MAKRPITKNPYPAELIRGLDAIATFMENVKAPPAGDPLFKVYKEARKACGVMINTVGNLADLSPGDMCQGGLPRRTVR